MNAGSYEIIADLLRARTGQQLTESRRWRVSSALSGLFREHGISNLDQLACLHRPEQWPDLQSFAVIESQRCVSGKTSTEQRFYLSSLAPDAARLGQAIRAHWSVENRLHWCMDVAFADDQMRARTGHAAHNLAVLKHITLNLIRLDPTPRKGGIKARRLIAATSDLYRAQLLGLA